MNRSILALSALVAMATAAIGLAPMAGASMNLSARPQPLATPNTCELSGYPLFALANISNAEQGIGRHNRPRRPDSSTTVTFYNMSACGYQLDQYTDSNDDTHCELVSANNTVIVQFWFDPQFYTSNGATNLPLTCSTAGPQAQTERAFASRSRVRPPSLR